MNLATFLEPPVMEWPLRTGMSIMLPFGVVVAKSQQLLYPANLKLHAKQSTAQLDRGAECKFSPNLSYCRTCFVHLGKSRRGRWSN